MTTKTIDNSYNQQIIYVYQYLLNIGTPSTVADNIIKQVLYMFSQYRSSQIDQSKMQMKLLQLSIRLSISVSSSQAAATTDVYSSNYQANRVASSYDNVSEITDCNDKQVSTNNYHGNCHGNYHAIVCSLDPVYKHILGLRYYLNMTYQDIAEILELDPNQIMAFMHEARRQCL